MTAIQYAAEVVTYATFAAAWGFIVLYHVLTRGDWRTTTVGRHVMALVAVDAAIFTMLTLAHLWPWLAAQAWYQWLYVCVVAGIAVVTVWRAVILWRVQHRP